MASFMTLLRSPPVRYCEVPHFVIAKPEGLKQSLSQTASA